MSLKEDPKLEIRENVRRASTRPLVLLVALLSAVAIALVAWQTLAFHTPAAVPVHTTFHFYQDRPGPDAPSRNRPIPSEAPDSVVGFGH
jgi:hypothetical protein